MNSSNVKHISVSSPHTYNMNNIHVPPKVLMPPVFQPASWERASGRDGSSASSSDDSQESDSKSLAEERQYQLGLQQRILENEGLVGLDPDDILEDDSLEEDSLEEMSSGEKGAEHDTNYKGKQKNYGSGRKKQPVDKYSNLRYKPHWKRTKKGAEFFKAEKASQASVRSSEDFSLDSFYLHSDGSSENNQQEAKTQDSLSELFSFHGANVVASNEPDGPQAKRREPAEGFHSRDNPGRAFPPEIQQDPPQRAKKNFVKKNKRTLGLQSEKRNSYLELHNKKQQVLHRQVTDPTPADEEPLQGIPAFQTGKMKPEDNGYPKGQQLKEQHKFSQTSKTESNQTLNGRAFPRNDSQQLPGGAAEAKSWHQQIPGFQAAPSAVERDSSTELQECLNPSSSVGPGPAEKSKTGLNNFPNATHPDFTTSTYRFLPIFRNFNPAEDLYPEYPSKESKKHQHDSPHGIPRQHSTSHIPGQHFSRDNSTGGQAHPKFRSISSIFNASFQERAKDQAPLQDLKNHIHEDNSSPTASCGTSHFTEMEQHQPGISGLRDDFADKWLWSLLPPALSQVQGGSQGDSGRAEGNPRKMRRSNSEGSLLPMEKKNQPRASKKVCSSKFYINLNMKLGGLGPDYEAIKEKKQKLKLQKEYSRQINEYNMKNITVVQRLPAKPQVSSVSRQKALEYAKKIPRPKTFVTKQPDQEVKEERALPQAPAGTSLPQIPSLESLWNRHEKEKEVVAAFKALHIL
ncbi:jhy protein homolog [Corvus hawaiiensis]|uniref:jhy protein homolog n=1 Tax=Corvus hawaiiensis TaxID=134902 RepID=UPI00201910B7|nr:jhy protein homolog [Corvus hawaiiensis]